jgi:cell division protein FtsZ
MIEFKQDSSFRIPEASDNGGQWIIGVGSSGVAVLDQLVLENEGVSDLMIVDTDQSCVRGSVVTEKYLLGRKSVRGMGCGGDAELGAELYAQEEVDIRESLKGTRLAVIVAGLGGGTASGVLPSLVETLKNQGAATIVVVTTPFSFEGRRRQTQATKALAKLRAQADAVLCFSNQSLLQLAEGETDLRMGFVRMNSLLSKVALTLRRSVTQRGLMQVSLADIRQLAHDGEAKSMDLLTCRAATARAEGGNRVEDVVEEVLASPLLQEDRLWVRSHSMLASLSGGSDMSMSEFQAVMNYLRKQIPVEIPLVAAAQVDKRKKQSLELTLVVTGNVEELEDGFEATAQSKQTEQISLLNSEPTLEEEFGHAEGQVVSSAAEGSFSEADRMGELRSDVSGGESSAEELAPELDGFAAIRASSHSVKTERYFNRQEELPLDKKIPRGRFEKSVPTMWRGQDLDQPTFMRQGIKVKI